ncbi:MAG: hypothetical protein L6Q54_03435 [Leptospiraceae bacterium]|nr:hypothetical protein [Leptospiraceae bacterium]NUM41105.1 hypothetical protein [Leptospiraceae bacterium]
MKRKFFIFLLIIGILFSIDCKELMRNNASCPLTQITKLELPPCHGVKENSKKDKCNCKAVEKAILDKPDFTYFSPIFSTSTLLEQSFFRFKKPTSIQDLQFSYLKIPSPLISNITTIHLQI